MYRTLKKTLANTARAHNVNLTFRGDDMRNMLATKLAGKVGFKDVTQKAQVPENDLAYLMYYLHCVTAGCGLDIIENDLVDYQNYARLPQSRQELVFEVAKRLSPEEVLRKTLFIDENGSICGEGCSGKFFELSQGLQFFQVQSEVVILGKKRNIRNILIVKESWINEHYVEPMQRNEARLQTARISSVSSHCEHCSGKGGSCTCQGYPGTSQSSYSPVEASTGHQNGNAELLKEKLKVEEEIRLLNQRAHDSIVSDSIASWAHLCNAASSGAEAFRFPNNGETIRTIHSYSTSNTMGYAADTFRF